MIQVINAVLEDIRLGLELPVVNQRRIISVKFLGELYNYQLINSCGQYFEHGSSKKKLDNFLVFFSGNITTYYNIMVVLDL